MKIVLDWEREQLRAILKVVDKSLEPLLAVISWNEQARDSAEYWVGAGFVACQKYIAATAAVLDVEKRDALDLGPVHSGGATIASLVNAAANAWKHGDDWMEAAIRASSSGVPEPRNKQKDRALDLLDTVLDDRSWNHPLSGTLAALGGDVSFASLLPLLVEWTAVMMKRSP